MTASSVYNELNSTLPLLTGLWDPGGVFSAFCSPRFPHLHPFILFPRHVFSSCVIGPEEPKEDSCLDIQSVYPGGGRVPIPERCSLLKDGVGLNMRLIEEVCQDTVTGMLIVRVSEDDAFKELLAKVEKGKKVYGWTAGVEVTTVYLHNVLVQAGLGGILAVLGKQGEVIGRTIHKYRELPHIWNGIVSVRMKLGAQATIPAFIYNEASDYTVQVYCDKQQKVCHRCLEKGHIAAWCRKPLKTHATATATSTKTWASVAAGKPSPSPVDPAVAEEARNPVESVELVDNMDLGVTVVNKMEISPPDQPKEKEQPQTTELTLVTPSAPPLDDGIDDWATQVEKEEEKKRKGSGSLEENPVKNQRIGAAPELVAAVRKKGTKK